MIRVLIKEIDVVLQNFDDLLSSTWNISIVGLINRTVLFAINLECLPILFCFTLAIIYHGILHGKNSFSID